jgi:hypothetical protein
MLEHWPVPVTALDVATDYGTTHLLISGTEAAPVALHPRRGSHGHGVVRYNRRALPQPSRGALPPARCSAPGATHHSIPIEDAHDLVSRVQHFLAPGPETTGRK